MKKHEIVSIILGERKDALPQNTATAFAPTNIALCKYWGKRDAELNLPMTSSLSVSLGNKGATTTIGISSTGSDYIKLNNQLIDPLSPFAQRLSSFLDLFRGCAHYFFHLDISANIPIAAGLASSASGFASVVLALNALFNWNVSLKDLSILARLGSGSACRSITPGFVEWLKGESEEGFDSFGLPLEINWPEFRIGLLVISEQEKPLSSRVAMQRTKMTSALYSAWPDKVMQDMTSIKSALQDKNIELLGSTAECNALTMHATMLSAWPPISYCLPETTALQHKIWQLRSAGCPLYFTQDAGPNLKLIFLQNYITDVVRYFPEVMIINPFY